MIPIIILNWNGFDDTIECIEAIDRQSYRDFHIWLVDNGSGDHEVSAIRATYQTHPKITVVCNEDNLGFTGGNNQILEQILVNAATNWVVLLNNDTAPEPGWLEALLHTANESKAEMVSSRMINYFDHSRMDNAGHLLLNTLEVLPLGHDEPVDKYNTPIANAGACGGAALYSVAMLREIGILDPHFTTGYEDVEIGLRAILCGYASVYAPDAVVLHKGARSINKIRDFNYTVDIQRKVYYIIGKLFPWPVLLICLPLILLRFFGALVINLLSLRWKYLRVQFAAIFHLVKTDLKQIIRARSSFFNTHDVISSIVIFRKMQFFLVYDWKRFQKYILKGEKTVFEKF